MKQRQAPPSCFMQRQSPQSAAEADCTTCPFYVSAIRSATATTKPEEHMPLTYDDIPGSWGQMSEGWPETPYTPGQMAALHQGRDRALRLLRRRRSQAAAVPVRDPEARGGYDYSEAVIRVETEALKQRLEKVHHEMFEVCHDLIVDEIENYSKEEEPVILDRRSCSTPLRNLERASGSTSERGLQRELDQAPNGQPTSGSGQSAYAGPGTSEGNPIPSSVSQPPTISLHAKSHEKIIRLGDLVKDRIGGKQGTAIERHYHLNGCEFIRRRGQRRRRQGSRTLRLPAARTGREPAAVPPRRRVDDGQPRQARR
jgi:hypothetical protein